MWKPFFHLMQQIHFNIWLKNNFTTKNYKKGKNIIYKPTIAFCVTINQIPCAIRVARVVENKGVLWLSEIRGRTHVYHGLSNTEIQNILPQKPAVLKRGPLVYSPCGYRDSTQEE